jgi:hypothetical protein
VFSEYDCQKNRIQVLNDGDIWWPIWWVMFVSQRDFIVSGTDLRRAGRGIGAAQSKIKKFLFLYANTDTWEWCF